MNNSNYYIITPNRKASFEIDINNFQFSLLKKWNTAQLSIKIDESKTENILNFKLINKSLEEVLSGIISNDKIVIGLESRFKEVLFSFIIWVRNFYPENEHIYLINDNNLEEFIELPYKTEMKYLKDTFID